ncbi:alanyl-tRNA editing protein [Clostridium sardiniense]|uniref:alanyl-tRNA editing protein n=1 Tax=Clostridium sardiniense TaxID=29369 RepID=UPI003D3307ED
MEKLYYIDQYIKEFTAEIEEIIEKDDRFHVILDKTAFFPGGGGQPCDLGFIGEHEVLDVYEEAGKVYHVVSRKPIKIHKVKCKIDWERRFDYMQQHLAQHTLSGCFFKLFNHNTAGIHLGKEISTIDIVGEITEEQIREAEKYANKVINENLKVEFLFPEKRELKKMGLRRDLPKTNEKIRIVKIEDLDINACCGVHPSRTIELQAIKLGRYEKHKGNTRIEYLAGNRAINDSFKKDEFSRKICRFLSCSEDEAINSINNLNNELKIANSKNKELTIEISEYKSKELIENSDKISDVSVIREIYDNEDVKYVSKIATKLTEMGKVITLMAVKNNDKVNLIFAASKNIKNADMNNLLKDSISLIDGRGGGSKILAQGGGKNNNNLDSLLDYAFKKVKSSLE